MTPGRRRLGQLALAGAAAAFAAGNRAARAQALPKVRVQLGWIANVQYAGEWIALERGLFRRHGIEVEWYPGGPNALPSPVVLAAGRADLGYTAWFPLLDAVARGNDLVMIAAVFPKNPLGLISLPRKPVRTAQDLVGARILAQGPNEKTAIDATLALNNLPVRWTQVPAGFSPEPLLAGEGDAYTAFSTNQTITLERMGMVPGKDFFFVSFDELGFRSYGSVLAAPRAWLERNRAQAVAYLRGLSQAWDENEKDPAVAPKLAVEKYGADFGLDLRQQSRQNELQIPLARAEQPGGRRLSLDRALIEGPLYAAARAAGRTNLPDPARLCDFELVAEAQRGL
jgi:ABC-type nitrate/sulfonate/bicarbonate transport system substrate-binding protein